MISFLSSDIQRSRKDLASPTAEAFKRPSYVNRSRKSSFTSNNSFYSDLCLSGDEMASQESVSIYC